MSADSGIVAEVIARLPNLRDDALVEISASIEELLIKRRAALYEARYNISVRFSEAVARGDQPDANLSTLERISAWWRRYDVSVVRLPRRGIAVRLVDWRMREWREIIVPRRAAGQIVKFLSDARPGRVQITATNGSLGDFMVVPGSCRKQVLAAIVAATINVEK